MMDAHARYKRLCSLRDPFLSRARTCSSLTIPSLYPEEGTGADALRVPEQGLGARGVKNLASKLLLGLFPPNQAFFRLNITDAELNAELKASEKVEIERGLMRYERVVRASLNKKYLRLKIYQVLRLLIVGGNALLYKKPNGFRVYRLDSYVVSRFGDGTIDESIIREVLPTNRIPDGIKVVGVDETPDENSVYLYTVVTHTSKGMDVHQEIEGQLVPNSERSYGDDEAPFVCLRMNAVDGEDYGRSYVEEHVGDLYNYEQLNGSINKITAAISRLVWLVNPNSATNIRTLNNAQDGEFVEGRREDVQALLVEKNADLGALMTRSNTLADDLKKSFMLMEGVQRSGERVTAEEIRRLAGDLETTLGGAYSLFSEELQLPIVRITLAEAVSSGAVNKLPKGIEPVVITGIDAMGNAAELSKLNSFINQLAPLGQEVIKEYLNVEDYMNRVAVATNLDIEGLINTQQSVDEKRRKEMENQTAQQVAGNVLK
jgi:hypothetical protein